MLAELEPFKRIILILQFYGLTSDEKILKKKWKSVLQFLSFLIFFVLTFFLFNLRLFLTHEVDAVIKGLTIVPTQLIMAAKLLNFYFKSESIKKLLKDLSDAYEPANTKRNLRIHINQTLTYFKISTGFALFILISGRIGVLTTGIFATPYYFPPSFESSKYFFVTHFTMELGMGSYCMFSLLALDAFPMCLLIMIHGSVKSMQESFCKAKLDKTSLKKIVETHQKLNR
jgi:hypothetical protein